MLRCSEEKLINRGADAPPPQPGLLLVLISWSGETKSVLEWRDDYNKGGANVFSIVGTAHASLTENSKSYVLEAPVEKFYIRAAFLLSPLAGGVMEKFRKCGIQHFRRNALEALDTVERNKIHFSKRLFWRFFYLH